MSERGRDRERKERGRESERKLRERERAKENERWRKCIRESER